MKLYNDPGRDRRWAEQDRVELEESIQTFQRQVDYWSHLAESGNVVPDLCESNIRYYQNCLDAQKESRDRLAGAGAGCVEHERGASGFRLPLARILLTIRDGFLQTLSRRHSAIPASAETTQIPAV